MVRFLEKLSIILDAIIHAIRLALLVVQLVGVLA
jgi:hypothetical protein